MKNLTRTGLLLALTLDYIEPKHRLGLLNDDLRQALVRAQAGTLSRSRGQRREADELARQAAADADLARVRSDRAQAEAAVQQRRDEIAGLRSSLGLEAAP